MDVQIPDERVRINGHGIEIVSQSVLTVRRRSIRDHMATLDRRKLQYFCNNVLGFTPEGKIDISKLDDAVIAKLQRIIPFDAVLLSFDEAEKLSTAGNEETTGTWKNLLSEFPKLHAWSNNHASRNRNMSPGKKHESLNSYRWCRTLLSHLDVLGYTEIQASWYFRSPQDITRRDYRHCPGIRKFLGNPNEVYWNAKKERRGSVPAPTMDMDTVVAYREGLEVEPEKKVNRQSIAVFDFVPWVSFPNDLAEVTVKLRTQESFLKEFSELPGDGEIPVTSAFRKVEILAKDGKGSVPCHSGDKWRSIRDTSFKGSIVFIPPKEEYVPKREGRNYRMRLRLTGDPGAVIYLVEGVSLKNSLKEDMDITYPVSEFFGDNPPFALETPSVESRMVMPKVSGHIWQDVISRIRKAQGDEVAAQLVPKLSEATISLASGNADDIDYVNLCIFPSKDSQSGATLPFNRTVIMEECVKIMDGRKILDLEPTVRITAVRYLTRKGEFIELEDARELDDYDPDRVKTFVAGVNKTGLRLLRRESHLQEDIWSALDDKIVKTVYSELHPNVAGVGGKLQLQDNIPHSLLVVSGEIGRDIPGDITQVVGLYWPQKNHTCLIKFDVAIDTSLDGRVIRMNPEMAEGETADSDGDNFFLIWEPALVQGVPYVRDPLTVTDGFTGETTTYSSDDHPCPALSFVRDMREHYQEFMSRHRERLSRVKGSNDPFIRKTRENDQARGIGGAFTNRDIICDFVEFDDRTRVMCGEIAHDQLGGLKTTESISTPMYVMNHGELLSSLVHQPMRKMPFDDKGRSYVYWDLPVMNKYRSFYGVFTGRMKFLDTIVGTAKNASADATSVFEFFVAHTNVSLIETPSVVTYSSLKERAVEMREGFIDDNGRTEGERALAMVRNVIGETGKAGFTHDGALTDAKSADHSPRAVPHMRAEWILDMYPVDMIALEIHILSGAGGFTNREGKFFRFTEPLGLLRVIKETIEKRQQSEEDAT
jgi:hypothetical protein